MFYSVYCKSCSLKNNNRAFYCNCSTVAPLLPGIFLWSAETRKKLNSLSCIHVFDLVLKYCSDINEGNGLQVRFYIFLLMNIAAPVLVWVFFSCVSGFRLKFSRIALLRKRLRLWFQKWFDDGWFGFEVFCWTMPHFVNFISAWTEIGMNCSFVILFWRHQSFSRFNLARIPVSSLNMLVPFSHSILKNRLISFRNAIQLYSLSFCVFQFIFCGISGKTHWLLMKTKYSVFQVFVLTVFWCSTCYTVIIVLWKLLTKPLNALTR